MEFTQFVEKGCKMPEVSGIIGSRHPQPLVLQTNSHQQNSPRLFNFPKLSVCQNQPQTYPNLLLCCLKPARSPHLVFSINQSCQQKTRWYCTRSYKTSPTS